MSKLFLISLLLIACVLSSEGTPPHGNWESDARSDAASDDNARNIQKSPLDSRSDEESRQWW
uniref:Uncharacterized protein n=1 Tax=Isometrus maculatus TaxID=497827 RepID=A0A0U1TZ69_ISOMC|nr:hypothetical protein [Isometrus maculatus]